MILPTVYLFRPIPIYKKKKRKGYLGMNANLNAGARSWMLSSMLKTSVVRLINAGICSKVMLVSLS